MRSLIGRVVFEADGESYRWEDVVAFAMVAGGWDAFERAAGEGLALVAAGYTVPPEQVKAAERSFRRERRLLAATELQEWLSARSLTVRDLRRYLERVHLREQWGDRAVAATAPDEILRAEGIFSGTLQRFATELAGRAAARAWLVATQGSAATSANSDRTAQRLSGLLGLSEPAALTACARQHELAAAFDTFCELRLTEAALWESVERHRLDWVVVECLQAGFNGEHAAAEAAMCIREREADLSEVARRARVPVRFRRLRVEEAEPALRAPLLSAQVDEVVGPVQIDGAPQVLQLVAKTAPTLSDHAVHGRAREEVLQAGLRAEVGRRVIWREAV